MIERIAKRYRVLPSAVLNEDASLLRHVALMELVEAASGQ